ncbi:hypothetical protein [uncultured Maritimibacter sp.]|uniref:hypothetical protein n=1 Tax=uncultured Maritimibacter sp. TaxID=991866 RepID=UPI00259678C1|nr:hypothetical protein [uncultured Maritimibacter sp.]
MTTVPYLQQGGWCELNTPKAPMVSNVYGVDLDDHPSALHWFREEDRPLAPDEGVIATQDVSDAVDCGFLGVRHVADVTLSPIRRVEMKG